MISDATIWPGSVDERMPAARQMADEITEIISSALDEAISFFREAVTPTLHPNLGRQPSFGLLSQREDHSDDENCLEMAALVSCFQQKDYVGAISRWQDSIVPRICNLDRFNVQPNWPSLANVGHVIESYCELSAAEPNNPVLRTTISSTIQFLVFTFALRTTSEAQDMLTNILDSLSTGYQHAAVLEIVSHLRGMKPYLTPECAASVEEREIDSYVRFSKVDDLVYLLQNSVVDCKYSLRAWRSVIRLLLQQNRAAEVMEILAKYLTAVPVHLPLGVSETDADMEEAFCDLADTASTALLFMSKLKGDNQSDTFIQKLGFYLTTLSERVAANHPNIFSLSMTDQCAVCPTGCLNMGIKTLERGIHAVMESLSSVPLRVATASLPTLVLFDAFARHCTGWKHRSPFLHKWMLLAFAWLRCPNAVSLFADAETMGFVDPQMCNLIIRNCFSSRNGEMASCVNEWFQRNKRLQRFDADVIEDFEMTYSKFQMHTSSPLSTPTIDDLCRQQDCSLAVDRLRQAGHGNVPICTQNRVLKCLVLRCLAGKASEAEVLALSSSMRAAGSADAETLNCVVAFLYDVHRPTDVENTMRLFEESGVQLDADVWDFAITSAVNSRHHANAWSAFSQMTQKGFRPSSLTERNLLDAVTASTPLELFSRLASGFVSWSDPVMFSSLVEAAYVANDTHLLDRCIRYAREESSRSSASCLNAILKAAVAVADLDLAVGFWEEMITKKFQLKQDTFNTLVGSLLEVDRLDDALSVLRNTRGVVPLQLHVISLIRWLVSAKNSDDAVRVYGEARDAAVPVPNVTFNTLINCCVNTGNVDKALALWRQVGTDPSFRPDVITFSTVVKGYVQKKNVEAAIDVYVDMRGRMQPGDVVIYNNLLEGITEVGDLQQVDLLLDLMDGESVIPSLVTMTLLIKFFGRRYDADTTIYIWDRYPTLFKFDVDIFSYTAIISALLWCSEAETAMDVFEEMLAKGLWPTSNRFFGTLVNGFIKSELHAVCLFRRSHRLRPFCCPTMQRRWEGPHCANFGKAGCSPAVPARGPEEIRRR